MKPTLFFKIAFAGTLIVIAASIAQVMAQDLVVTNVAVLGPTVSGQNFTLTYTVLNQGDSAIDSNVTWSDQIHLCTSTALSSSTKTWTWNWKGLVPPGGSYSTTNGEMLPSLVSGTYYLIAVTDTGHSVPGDNFDNNTNTPVPFQVTAPDLVVTNVTVVGAAESGQPTTVDWEVLNQGDGPAIGSWRDRLYLCSSTNISSSITYWYWAETGPVAVGSTYTNASGNGFTLPTLSAGTYYWIAITDAGHTVSGDNFSNNTNAPVPFQVTAPDLVVTNLTVEGTAESGQPITVDWEVLNQGDGPAIGSWQDRLYLCSSTNISSSITYWYWAETGPVAVGATYTNTSGNGITLPTLSAGTYYWIAITDTRHTVSGDNFNNNTNAPVPFQVTAPDLAVTNVTVLGQAISSQSFTMSYNETNQGSAPVSGNWTDGIYLSTNATSSGTITSWTMDRSGTLAVGGSFNLTNSFTLPVLQTGTNYLFVVTDIGHSLPEGNFDNNTSAPVAMFIMGPPQITIQPTNQTADPGMSVTFSVGVSSLLPVTYEWRKNGTNLVNAGNISGSTNSILIINNVSTADVATYSVVASSIAGSVTSKPAVLRTSGSALLTFEGLKDLEDIDNYYDGGFGSLGSGPGPNYGIVFTSNSLAVISVAAGGKGKFSGNPSGITTASFLSGAGATLNAPGGFTGGFWFFYSAALDPGLVTVWSGPNGTGTQIASITLPVTPQLPGGYLYDNWQFHGVTFSGRAYSVVFGGTADYIGYDDITLGSYSPISGTAISNVRTSPQIATNEVDVYYDLSGVSVPVHVSVLMSTNGGTNYNIQPLNVSGDGVTTPVASGNNYHLVWNAGEDLPNFLSSDMRVQLSVLGGGNFAQAASHPIFTLDTLPTPLGELTGTVLATNGLPVSNAVVAIEQPPVSTSTSSNGTFTLSNVPVGNGYVLNVSAAGYATKRLTSVNVPIGGVNLGNIMLANVNGPISLIPLVPDVNPAIATVEQGGTAYRYYQTVSVTNKGTPLPNIPVTVQIQGSSPIIQTNDVSKYWPGRIAGISDPDGIVRIAIPASALSTNGVIQTVELSFSNVLLKSFQARVIPLQYVQFWKQKLGSGISAGLPLISVGEQSSAESDLRRYITNGITAGESISRSRTVDGTVSVGVDVGSSLSVSSVNDSFIAGNEVGASADAFFGVGLSSTFTFDPNATDPDENAMKLYVDLGNVLSGASGLTEQFYNTADSVIEPLFLASNLDSLKGDIQAGGGYQGQVTFGSPVAGLMTVGFNASASADMQFIYGDEARFGINPQTASVIGAAASGSATINAGVSPTLSTLPFMAVNNANYSWAVNDDVELEAKQWTRQGQSRPYRTESIRKLGLGVDQQMPVPAWQRYDPSALYSNNDREFTEIVNQTNGNITASYQWLVDAEQEELGVNFKLDLGVLGVNFQGELDHGVEAVNQLGTIMRSRYWPAESYPAITANMFPTQSWASIISQWGNYAEGPIGQAINTAVTDVQNGVNTSIQAGQATLNVDGTNFSNALSGTAQVVSSFATNIISGLGHLPLVKAQPLGNPIGNGVAYLPPDGSSNYKYGVDGVYRFSSTNTFSGSATLTISYTNADIAGLDPTQFQIYQLPDGTNRWQLVRGIVDTNAETVTATITNLGTFAIAPPMPTGDLQLILSTNALPADGISQMTVTITNLMLNNGNVATQQWLFTATANGVQILNPDCDTNLSGTQVVSTNGAITLLLQAPLGGTVANVSLASVAGDAYGSAEINIIDTTPPATPTKLIVNAGQSRIWVSWTADTDSDLAGYRVYYRAASAGPPWNGTAEIEGNPSPVWVTGTNCLLRGLSLGTNYFVAVSAVDTTGNESPLSPAKEVTTISSPPMPPTDVAVHFGSDGTNVLMWALSTDDGYNDRDVTQYYIWRAILPGGSYTNIGQVAAGIGVFTDPNPKVALDQTVSYAVSAVADSGLTSTQVVATVVTPTSVVSTNVVIGPAKLLSNGQFQLTVNGGVPGQNYVLLASTNLVDWTPISGFVDTNPPVTIYDPDASKYRWRFYRIGPESTAPAMQFGLNSAQPLASNGFNVVLYSLPGLNYEIQASSNLIDWTTVTNFISTNSPFYLSVPTASTANQEFYRAVMP